MDAAMNQLQTGRLPVGGSKKLAPGATIRNTSRFAEREPKSISGGSDQDYKQRLTDANANMNDWTKDPKIKHWNNKATNKSFVDMVFNQFGDLFHKANPHEVGSIIMGLYLDRMVK